MDVQHVSGSGQCGGIRGILLVTPLEDDHAQVERHGGDNKQDGQSECKEDEDLTALLGTLSC